jgi:hypothetical protein
MNELFPLNALSPKQSVIASELLRDHPKGRVENHEGKPVFVTDGKNGPVYVQLSVSKPARTGTPFPGPRAQ